MLVIIMTIVYFQNPQVVRLKLSDGKRIVGTLIPSSAMTPILKALSSGSEDSMETIH